MITDTDRAYLAGLVDGEGCISIVEDGSSEKQWSPRLGLVVFISSCEKDVLDYWANKTQIGRVYIGTKARGNARTGYLWQIRGAAACEFLWQIYPYLIAKKEQADVAFKFQETVGRHTGSKPGNWGGKNMPGEVIKQRYFYKDELTRLKGTTKRGRPRIHDSRRRDFAEELVKAMEAE